MGCYHLVDERRWEPFAMHVVEASDAGITDLTHYLGASVFTLLGLPAEIVT